MEIRTKRVYEPRTESDGLRILVDRAWPRGVTKESLALDSWECELTASKVLCSLLKARGLDWDAFSASYRAELESSETAQRLVERLVAQKPKTVTILYASASTDRNHATLLAEYLRARVSEAEGERAS